MLDAPYDPSDGLDSLDYGAADVREDEPGDPDDIPF